jgi:hypothetical protein
MENSKFSDDKLIAFFSIGKGAVGQAGRNMITTVIARNVQHNANHPFCQFLLQCCFTKFMGVMSHQKLFLWPFVSPDFSIIAKTYTHIQTYIQTGIKNHF